MVPEGWEEQTLSDIVKEKISYGIVQAGPHVEDGVPYIKSSDVGGAINATRLQRTSSTIHHKYRRSAVHPGDIVFSLRGNIGELSIVPPDLSEANLTQGTARISVGKGSDNLFVYYQLGSTPTRKRVNALSKGSTFKEISLEELRKVRIPVAPLSEQRKIAKILSAWDKAITTTEKLLANSQRQKKALTRLLISGNEKWKYKAIKDISTRIQRKSDGSDYPVLTISSLRRFVRQDEKYSRYMAGESVKNYVLLKQGEFAYNKGNSKTYQFGCVFDLQEYPAGLVPHVYVCFRLKDAFSPRFYRYLFEADYLRPQLGALVNTGVRNNGLLNIKPSDFLDTKVPVPPIEEQERIADVLDASSIEKGYLSEALECLRREKAALMQQLLSGKRRVVDQGENG